MGTKLPAAQKRMFGNIFVCRECSHRMRTQASRVISKKVRCRLCGCNSFRTIRKK